MRIVVVEGQIDDTVMEGLRWAYSAFRWHKISSRVALGCLPNNTFDVYFPGLFGQLKVDCQNWLSIQSVKAIEA